MNYCLHFIYQDILFGATDAFGEGTWLYMSSWENLTFSDWIPEEPNNGNSIEHCGQLVALFEFLWNDVRCDVPQSFICERMIG